MFRVYDTEQLKWVDNVYMSTNGDLYLLNNSFLNKLKQLPDDGRYVCHRDVLLYDKNDVLVYEGDYLEAKISEDKIVIGLVAYAHEMSAYIILCEETNEFYTLGSEVTEFISVIGNVFDGYEQKQENK